MMKDLRSIQEDATVVRSDSRCGLCQICTSSAAAATFAPRNKTIISLFQLQGSVCYSASPGVMPHCLDEGTVRSVRLEEFNGKEWENAMGQHQTIRSMSKT